MFVRSGSSRVHSGLLKGLLVLSLLGATPSIAAAGDGKLVPATVCSYENEPTSVPQSRFDGQFRNDTAQTRGVICPIVKDSIGGPLLGVALLTTEFPWGTCRVIRRSFTGESLEFFAPNDTDPHFFGFQHINWQGFIDAPATSMSVRCDVPPGHSVLSIQHDEPQ
jgi:hypothetical protein